MSKTDTGFELVMLPHAGDSTFICAGEDINYRGYGFTPITHLYPRGVKGKGRPPRPDVYLEISDLEIDAVLSMEERTELQKLYEDFFWNREVMEQPKRIEELIKKAIDTHLDSKGGSVKAPHISGVVRERCRLVNYLSPNQNIERDMLEAVLQRACHEPMSTNTIIAFLKFGRAQAFHPNKEEPVPEAGLIEALCHAMENKFPGPWAKTPAGTEP